MGISRRTFLVGAGVGATGVALGLYALRPRPGLVYPEVVKSAARELAYGDWSDLYRERWQWDRVAKSSHNRANCFSACSWNLFVKEGVVWREEQHAVYDASREGLPDFNPRGCQKGACHSDLEQSEARIRYPLRRVGERGEGKWKRISWDEAYDAVADACIDAALEAGSETIVHDHGTTNIDYGPDALSEMRWTLAMGTTLIDSWAGVGDMPNGVVQTQGIFMADGTADDWFLSDYIVVWVANPAYTRIPDVHFIHEARYRGAKLVVVSPDLSATSIHADLWVNVKQETDAAFGLAAANVIIEEGLYDEAAVREQTDLPFLVREDDGRYLRESDLHAGGSEELFYLWDEAAEQRVPAPGCAGEGSHRIALEGIEPALEGRWPVELADGSQVRVRPLFQLLREHLNASYTPEKQEATTGVKASVVRAFARGMAGAKASMVYASLGACKNHHSDLFQRSIALLMAITGNQGRQGGGLRIASFWPMKGLEEISGGDFRPSLPEIVQLASKGLTRGLMPTDWEELYTQYTAHFPITPLMPFLYHHAGYDTIWNRPAQRDSSFPRELSEYMNEAVEKGWVPVHPAPGTRPRVFIFSGCNPLRRWPSPQTAREQFWPKLDLIVSVNFRMSTSTLWSDIVLPAASYYEKYGVKYGVSAMPYIVPCEQATAPLGESKSDYEIFASLAQRVSERAKARGITEPVKGPKGRPLDLTGVFDSWSLDGELDPQDPLAVMDRIFRRTDLVGNISAEQALELGVVPVVKTGDYTLSNQSCSTFEPGDTLTPYRWFAEDKIRWPTITGRMQFLIDHPWFIEAGESLPVHKDSPGMLSAYPLRLTSAHTRWSIHAISRDQKLLLQLQRGEPVVWMHPGDMASRGLEDHDAIRVHNEHGAFEARVKPADRMQPGTLQIFHAWEPYQFKGWEGPQAPVVSPLKPTHLAGGYGQLHYRMFYNAPSHNPRGVGVEVEKAEVEKAEVEKAEIENA
ncbi:MAG: molybdopterin-dependent oxidoreductase [Deltaproteobacteria bacterium]|nr:molybdopterin-dependent oxidoreductase [Deltaproteobacteria bacterium]